jgi:beta-glucosidase
MKKCMTQMLQGFVLGAGSFSLFLAVQPAAAQSAATPAYLDTSLTPEQRAADLVHRMTLAEKATQMQNNSAAVTRLNIPAYQWWSEALHGVINDGVTEYPEPIGLAATFDAPGIHTMAAQIGIEGRIKHVQNVREGHTGIMGGLDFWSPNLNIFRDPRWGRGQETYGEDPFLTGRMGVAYVTGLQGDDPKYYLAIATPKHYAVHSGPEPTRHFADVDVSKHDEVDTYTPAFRAAVVEGKAGSVMCAYNAINGEPACANEFLLQDELRGKWGFKGYVVSDCDAVLDIAANHRYRPTQAQGAAISVIRGMDNECVNSLRFGEPAEKAYVDAVQQGYLPEATLDTALIRLFTARIKLGMFDPPDMVPYLKIDEKELDSAKHRAQARKLANESMVLLKNDGILPIKAGIKKITVVGSLANQTKMLLGNYAGKPTHIVSILDGIKAEFPNAKITYLSGTQFLRNDGDLIPSAVLTTPDGKPGLKAEYRESGGFPGQQSVPTIATRIEKNADLSEANLPSEVAGKKTVAVHWSGSINPSETGDYLLGVRGSGFARLSIDGKQVATLVAYDEAEAATGRAHLVKGQKAELSLDYGSFSGAPHAQLIWAKAEDAPSPEAITAAKDADVVIAVVGITSRLEGEEMPVTVPGFLGGDRTSIDLPQPEEDLVEAVAAAGKPLAVVLVNGSALGVNWINKHANAVLEAWYPGEEGGAAVAETLSGKNNSAGRLPVTFYTGVGQLPNFEDYGMANRTYRYFNGKPLYPFGYGLSYTTFNYTDLSLPAQAVAAGQPLSADVTVTNTGKVAGDEVVQVYLKFPDIKGAPQIALRGFQRIHLEPGTSQKVHFDLKPRDLGIVTEDGHPIIAQGDYTISIGGGQPDTGAPTVNGKFHINGQVDLPE